MTNHITESNRLFLLKFAMVPSHDQKSGTCSPQDHGVFIYYTFSLWSYVLDNLIVWGTLRTTEKAILKQTLFFSSTAIQFQTGQILRSGGKQVMQCSFRKYSALSFWRHSWMSLEMKHQWCLGPSHKDGQRLRNHADTTWATSCLRYCRPRGTAWPTACLCKRWENCTALGILVPFQEIPGGPWQAAAPPLHEPWHEECHRAQFFHHFYLISLQNLQGLWWSIWAAMPAITLMTRGFMHLFPPHADSTLSNVPVLKARVA